MPDEASADHSRKIFLIATEESGDRLGSSLMKALRRRLGDTVRLEGVGGGWKVTGSSSSRDVCISIAIYGYTGTKIIGPAA